MRKKEEDERITAQRRKIASDAFQILFYGLLVSILVQQYFFKAQFAQYAAEMILFLASAIYIVIRNIAAGNGLTKNPSGSQKIVVINSLVCGLSVVVISTVLNYLNLKESFMTDIKNTVLISVITFISAFIFAFILFEALFIINKARLKKMESKLNDEEDKL